MMMNVGVGNELLGKFHWRANVIADRLGKSLKPDVVVCKPQRVHDGEAKNEILHRLYSGKKILIGATTGDETIANAGNLFKGFLDPNFEKFGTNKPSGVAKEESPAKIYEQQQNATFCQMFGSLGNINDLCLEQGQIIAFCRKHRDKLRQKNWSTFFLFKNKGETFVVLVCLGDGNLEARIRRFFDDDYFWLAWGRRRLVVPQLD